MADNLLNSSVTALTTEISNQISTATVDELLDLARAANSIGKDNDTTLETAINTRVGQLLTNATSEDVKKLGDVIKKMSDVVVSSGTSFTGKTTDDLTEGSTNLYFTDARADARITNVIIDEDSFTSNSETQVPTQQSVKSYVDTQITTKDNTDEITEGSTNLYFTDARVQTKLGSVSGHILPDTNETYDLGSPTNKFRDAYLSGNTLHLGDAQITSEVGGTISLPTGSKVGSDPVPTTVEQLSNITLEVPPETLTIAVDADAAGGGSGMDWKWSWKSGPLAYIRATITNQAQGDVPLYAQGTYTLFNFAAHDITGTAMTQTHKIYLKWVDGPGTDNLVSWATSTLNVQNISFEGVRGSAPKEVQRLNINVPSTITPPTLTNPNISYDVSFASAGAYTFGGSAHGNNPTLNPLYRGGTYTFNLDASLSGHPFYLTTDDGTNYVSGSYVGEYTDGVTGSRNESGTLVFTVPSNAPDTLYYQCGIHGAMKGTINIKDLAVETNGAGNYVLYFQHDQQGHKTSSEIKPVPTIVDQTCLVFNSTTQKFEPQDMGTYLENTAQFQEKLNDLTDDKIVAKIADDTITNLTKVKDQTTFVTSLYQQGELQVHTGTARWYAPYDLTISDTIPKLNVAADATVSIQINKNDVSQSSIDILGGQTTASPTGTNKTWNMNAGDYLTVDILTIGTTNKGEDLVIQFKYKQT